MQTHRERERGLPRLKKLSELLEVELRPLGEQGRGGERGTERVETGEAKGLVGCCCKASVPYPS
jgi:hypothetical protein